MPHREIKTNIPFSTIYPSFKYYLAIYILGSVVHSFYSNFRHIALDWCPTIRLSNNTSACLTFLETNFLYWELILRKWTNSWVEMRMIRGIEILECFGLDRRVLDGWERGDGRGEWRQVMLGPRQKRTSTHSHINLHESTHSHISGRTHHLNTRSQRHFNTQHSCCRASGWFSWQRGSALQGPVSCLARK